MKNFLIDLLAFAALFSSVLVITSKNPVIAVIFLISVFVNAAGYLILLGIGFIGISYIIVYVGAIAVLFLFVIMLLNIKLTDILETSHQYTKNLPLAFSIGILFIYEIYTIIPFPIDNVSFISYFLNLINILNGLLLNSNLNLDNVVHIAINPTIADTTFINFSQIEAIGQGLYTYGGSWLIIISIILLLAMVAPIFITKPSKISSKLNNLTPLKGLNNKEFVSKFNKIGGKKFYHSSPIVKSALQSFNTKLSPWLVTGFTDAKGCFSVRLNTYKNTKIFISPVFSFHMHLNDLEILYRIKIFFGVGSVRTDKTGAHYQVTGLYNLQIILNHFKGYPLQGSKRHSLIIFSIILEILHKKEHFTDSGFLRAVSYINYLNKPIKRDFLNKIIKTIGPIPLLALPPVPILTSISIINPYWIVGFILGDGGFTFSKSVTISKKTNETRVYFGMQMFVSQLNIDAYLLRSICNHIGTGYIKSHSKNLITNLIVSDTKSILHLILSLFNKYPLLAHKNFQFNLWLKAVFIIIGTPKYSKKRQEELILALIELSNLQNRSKDKNKLLKFQHKTIMGTIILSNRIMEGAKNNPIIEVMEVIMGRATIHKILPMNQKVQINNSKYILHSFSLPLILGWLDIDPSQFNSNFSNYAYGVFLLSLIALLCFVNVLFYITIHYLIQVRNYELKYPKLNKIINLYKKVNILYIFIEALICFVCLFLIVFFSIICIYTLN